MALIKCKECGRVISDKAITCPNCGAPVEKRVICEECGTEMLESMRSCPKCGCPNPLFKANTATSQINSNSSTGSDIFTTGRSGKSRGVFALLAIFFGYLGIHFFYIGKNGAGVTNIVITLFSWILLFIPLGILSILTLIQGILALTMSEEEFERKYVNSSKFYPF